MCFLNDLAPSYAILIRNLGPALNYTFCRSYNTPEDTSGVLDEDGTFF